MSIIEVTGNPRHDQLVHYITERGYMNIEELAQLLVQDLRSAPGLGFYLNISDEAEHSHLKNQASRRRIPLHPELISCGFLVYVENTKPNRFLFPHLKM